MARQRNSKRREGNEIEFSRIVAFSDGVFAIAITLLVLALNIPEHLHGESVGEALWDQHENLLAYALSFAVIGRFWVVHHRFFSEVTGFDNRLLSLNIFYLAWIVLIPFSSKVLGDHGGETATVVLYAANLSGVVLTGMWMAADAHKAGLTSIAAPAHREQPALSLYSDGLPRLNPGRLPRPRPRALYVAGALLRPRQPPCRRRSLDLGPGDEGDRLSPTGAADGEAAIGTGGQAAVGTG